MRVTIILLILLVSGTFTAFAQQQEVQAAGATTQRPRVAVVLSGGSALGLAHIGVLKVIERMGIPIDMILGTSMGAIVGGL